MPPKTKAVAAPKAKPDYSTRKFTPRAPGPAEERLPKLYRALTDQVNDAHFDNAKKTCKRILALDPSSTSAFQTLLFLHLHTEDYAAALALVNNPPAPNAPALDFERSYCLYRLHKEKEALAALSKLPTHGRKEKHLEAQIRYRLGEFEAAQQLYDALLKDTQQSSGEYDDIRTNKAAAATQLAYVARDYKANLSAPAVENPASGLKAYTPSAGDLESYVPTVPSGWATRGEKPKASTSTIKKVEKTRTKPRHRLPKRVTFVEGQKPKEDPDRWLPLRQRASFIAAAAGKKKKEQTGLGTQGATGGGGGGASHGHGGGGGNKKKGKKK